MQGERRVRPGQSQHPQGVEGRGRTGGPRPDSKFLCELSNLGLGALWTSKVERTEGETLGTGGTPVGLEDSGGGCRRGRARCVGLYRPWGLPRTAAPGVRGRPGGRGLTWGLSWGVAELVQGLHDPRGQGRHPGAGEFS